VFKSIAISAIKISPNRQRKEFKLNEINELAESIRRNGLFHAITLRIEGEGYVLVSGERRLRAIQDIYDLGGSLRYDGVTLSGGAVPYITLGDLDAISREEAELDENLKRSDLTWQERAAAIGRLDALRKAQSTINNTPPPTAVSLAKELGSYDGDVRRDIILSRHLDKEEVKSAKNPNDALKALKRSEERAKNEELAQRVGAIFTADVHEVYNTDSIEWLKKCSAERFDVLCTDPPYGMGADQFGDSGSSANTHHAYDDSYEYFKKLMEGFCYHSFRVAKQQSHAYVFCDIDNFFDLRLWMSEAGWEVFRTPLIWHNPSGFRTPWVGYGPQRRYECILYAVKGKRPTHKVSPDIVSFPREPNATHPAQKPVDLYSDLLRRSVNPGDSVLDCFCGSGPIFPAANALKVKAVGVELDGGYYALSVKRIEALKSQLELSL